MSDTEQATQTEQAHTESYEHGMLFANMKRTYDEMQAVSLTSQQRSQDKSDKLDNLALQAMQNAIETANMVGKNAVNNSNQINSGAATVGHKDDLNAGAQSDLNNSVATNRTWNSHHDQSADMRENTFKDQIRSTMMEVLREMQGTDSASVTPK